MTTAHLKKGDLTIFWIIDWLTSPTRIQYYLIHGYKHDAVRCRYAWMVLFALKAR